MGLFSRFENKAEDVIEGSGGSKRGGIEPVKLAKRAFKEMEREKMVGVGHEYAPTLYNVLVSAEDDERMNGFYPSLAGEIETYLTSRAEQTGLVFDCPPLVRFIVDEGLKKGRFDIIAESVSPAIISELRHEEMVHYGLENDKPESQPAPQPVYGNQENYIEADPPVYQSEQSYHYHEPQAPEGYEQAIENHYHPQAQQPVQQSVQQPAQQQPYQAPVAEQPAQQQPVGQQPYQQPSAQQPIAEQQPAAQQPQGEPAPAYAQPQSLDQQFAPQQPRQQASAGETVMLDEPIPKRKTAVLYNYSTRQHYKLLTDRTTIGRETTCDVVIGDPSVSRRHAEILHGANGWLIRDTGSTNGTAVNGTSTTQSRIYNGDIINLGNTQLEFQEG